MRSKYRECLSCKHKFRIQDLIYKMYYQHRIDTIYCVRCHSPLTKAISNRRFYE